MDGRKMHNYLFSRIDKVGENQMLYILPSNQTVNGVSSKTLAVKVTRHEKTRFGAGLVSMAGGTKLLLIVSFKSKAISE